MWPPAAITSSVVSCICSISCQLCTDVLIMRHVADSHGVARPRLKDIYTWPFLRELHGCNTVTVHTIAVQDDQLRSADDKKEALAHAR